MVCKSRKEALRRRAELARQMGWKDDNAPKPKDGKENESTHKSK